MVTALETNMAGMEAAVALKKLMREREAMVVAGGMKLEQRMTTGYGMPSVA